MIIQCEQCQTKFRLDDSRVKDAGVKVRCAKCKHVFTVKKELPETLPQSDFAALLDQTPGFAEQAPAAPPLASATASVAAESLEDFAASPTAGSTSADNAAAMDSTALEPPEKGLPPSPIPSAESGLTEKNEWEPVLKTEKAPATETKDSIAGFDFDLGTAPTEFSATTLPSDAFSDGAEKLDFQVPADPAAQLPDFSDSMIGTDVNEEKAVTPKVIDADTFNFDAIDSAPKPSTVAPQIQIPVEPATDQALPVAPPKVQQQEAPADARPFEPAATTEQLPPLSITSRRKKRPLIKIIFALLILVAAAAALYFYDSSLFPLLTHKAAPEQERDQITIRSTNASFVKNTNIGELLIISGEAVNSYTTPRTAILVKGLVYGDNNQILASKNAYSGNILSREQLSTMPQDKIEAAMSNQFGKALDNLEVAPGKAVPFMIVITKLPEGAKSIGAVSAGSSAATKTKP